jgi:hypothetical protein
MAASTAEDLYALVLGLPVSERLRLVERIAHDLSSAAPVPAASFEWTRLAGAAPGLLGGEDAQTNVSASRQETDDARAGISGSRS